MRRVSLELCPTCDAPLGSDRECDLCEQSFAPGTVPAEEAFAPLDLGDPEPRSDGSEEETAAEPIRELVSRVLSPEVRNATINIQELHMGDRYTAGQAGVMGPHAKASHLTFPQIWSQVGAGLDLEKLAEELEQLHDALQEQATKATSHHVGLGEIAKARASAKKQDGPRVLKHLSAAGRWALDQSTKIGTELATAAIKAALGLDN